MKRFLVSTSFSILLLLNVVGCVSPRETQSLDATPIIHLDSVISEKFDLNLSIGKHSFSGMLIMRKIKNQEIRILGTTYFGLSLFDFSITHDGTFQVNKCIQPLQHKKLLKLLENDFKLLLSPSQNRKLLVDTALFKKYKQGRGFGKTYTCIFGKGPNTNSKIELRHPLIKLYLTLHPQMKY